MYILKLIEPDQMPCKDQSSDNIYVWAQRLSVGDQVALKTTSSHLYVEYKLGEVEALTDNGRRVMVKGVGTFWRTKKAIGKNCFHPKGQLTMIMPTSSVIDAVD